jgi:signal transduction histidine kinase
VTLRTRLTLWYTALLVLALALFSSVIVGLHWRSLLRQQDDGLRAMAEAAARTYRNELAETNAATAARETEELSTDDVRIRVLRAAGVEPDASARTVTDASGRSWRVLHEALQAGDVTGVEVLAPLDEAWRQHRTLLGVCLFVLPLVMAVAGMGGWWMAGRALRPLSRMAAEAETIDASRPERRLTTPADAGELVQVAASFNRLLDRLNAALVEQRAFMADASHELRTPLVTIRAAADVTLSRDDRHDGEYREALAAISEQGRRLGRLVDDMFLLARADAGGYPVSFSDVDLSAVLQECLDDLSARARDAGVTLTLTRLDAAVIAGDEALLRRLLLNLLANGIAYTPAGGSVRVALLADAEEVRVRVADTGPGIPAPDRERIFHRFVRLDPARSNGGAGLGLSIARWIADLHAASIEVEAEQPHGSLFVARFARSKGAVR